MKTRTLTALAAATAATLACAAPAVAATPFSGPTTGSGWDLAVGADGTGHAAWLTEEAGDRVQYCRVPAGGSACDSESALLSFPGGAAAEAGYDAQIFTPAPSKVVMFASCYVCGARRSRRSQLALDLDRQRGQLRGPVEVGSLRLEGQAAYLAGRHRAGRGGFALPGDGRRTLGDRARPRQRRVRLLAGGSRGAGRLAAGGACGRQSRHGQVRRIHRAVSARYRPADANTLAKWQSGKFLPAPEGDNDETHLSSGPNGVFLSYRNFVPNDDHVGLRRFDDATDTFGAPTYVEGANTIDNDGVNYPYHSQDSAGRLHFVWRTLYDGMRLRYTRSDDGGATWTPASQPGGQGIVLRPDCRGRAGGHAALRSGASTRPARRLFASLRSIPSSRRTRRPSTTPHRRSAASTPATRTLLPGQGTTFTFNTSEAGKAVLSFQKRVKGLKVKKGGKLRCVPKTKKLVPQAAPQAAPAARPGRRSARSPRTSARGPTRSSSADASPAASSAPASTGRCSRSPIRRATCRARRRCASAC